MTSFRQIEANRHAQLSPGSVTEEGKRKSRQNAARHVAHRRNVISGLKDAADNPAFETAVMADHDAQSAPTRFPSNSLIPLP